MMVKLILTFSYLLVIAGSVGMVLFATKFPSANFLWELEGTRERLCGLNGHQIWKYSWGAIILGNAGQLLAVWLR